ncbi:short-chain dehydrogenase/reductase [Streptomyces sp. NPDC007100]|uniref:short-chain dehydrogenase/reductase n=1 Tax=unclassified Streptomyces TaxID=2593676 RepID=UPI0033DF847D
MSRQLPLRGRTAVVTGAARGLGAEMARSLVRRGAGVALLGLEEDELERVAAELPGNAEYWPVDVTDEDAMDRAAALVERRFGPPSVVVANAGVVAGGPFLDTDPAVWRRVVEVNLIGSAVTARAFLPALLRTRGYFLQVASLAAIGPAPMLSAYCASKSGAETFAQVLRAELAHRGVRVGIAYLSWADTEMVRASDRQEAMRELRAHLPWPASKTYDAAPVADRLVRGVERRAATVYAQPWLRAGQAVRACLPGIVTEGSRRAFLRLAGRADLAGTGLLGAGGRAAEHSGRRFV